LRLTLTKLKETHTIAAYKIQFESTSNRVRDLSELHKRSCLMSGMKDEIRLAVKMQGPRNLREAYARIESKSGESRQPFTRPPMIVQKLTPMQMLERRKKGLCYHCDDRWSVGHKCKTMKLFVMEEMQGDEEDCELVEEEEGEAEIEGEQVEITLCALLGSSSPSTMSVVAILNGQKIVVLLDTSGTHNFMDSTLATSLNLHIDNENNLGLEWLMARLSRLLVNPRR
jgi:hypothetical protein